MPIHFFLSPIHATNIIVILQKQRDKLTDINLLYKQIQEVCNYLLKI